MKPEEGDVDACSSRGCLAPFVRVRCVGTGQQFELAFIGCQVGDSMRTGLANFCVLTGQFGTAARVGIKLVLLLALVFESQQTAFTA